MPTRRAPIPIILLLTLTLSLLSYDAARADGKTLILNYEGKIRILRNGKTLLVNVDLPLQKNDIIRTGPESYVSIAMNELVGIEMNSLSEIKILSVAESDMRVSLTQGWALLNSAEMPRSSSFMLETPAASARIKGTQFYVKVEKLPDQNIRSTFSVKKGIVDVTCRASSSTIVLLEGQALDVDLKTFIPPARVVSEEEADIMMDISSVNFTSKEIAAGSKDMN